jgi:hypothetical protein
VRRVRRVPRRVAAGRRSGAGRGGVAPHVGAPAQPERAPAARRTAAPAGGGRPAAVRGAARAARAPRARGRPSRLLRLPDRTLRSSPPGAPPPRTTCSQVPGVGPARLEKYGADFLRVLRGRGLSRFVAPFPALRVFRYIQGSACRHFLDADTDHGSLLRREPPDDPRHGSRFRRNEIAPVAGELDQKSEFPWENVKKMGELGLFGIPWSEELGGAGMDYISYMIAIHELAKVDASHAITISAHTTLGTSPIVAFGTRSRRSASCRCSPADRCSAASASPSRPPAPTPGARRPPRRARRRLPAERQQDLHHPCRASARSSSSPR